MSKNVMIESRYLENLMSGSFEASQGAVLASLEECSDLFGGPETSIIATWSEHLVAVDPSGKFYRAKWFIDEETGKAVFEDIEDVDVPFIESSGMGALARKQSRAIVDAILDGNPDLVSEALDVLAGIVDEGGSLTAVGISENMDAFLADSDWKSAISENSENVRTFVGDVSSTLSTSFKVLSESSSDVAEESRNVVKHGLVTALNAVKTLSSSISDAKLVDESFVSDDATGSVAEFVEFVSDFDSSLVGMTNLLEDAVSVADFDDVRVLGRIHDGIAAQFGQWALAASFVKEMATQFRASVTAE